MRVVTCTPRNKQRSPLNRKQTCAPPNSQQELTFSRGYNCTTDRSIPQISPLAVCMPQVKTLLTCTTSLWFLKHNVEGNVTLGGESVLRGKDSNCLFCSSPVVNARVLPGQQLATQRPCRRCFIPLPHDFHIVNVLPHLGLTVNREVHPRRGRNGGTMREHVRYHDEQRTRLGSEQKLKGTTHRKHIVLEITKLFMRCLLCRVQSLSLKQHRCCHAMTRKTR